MCAIRCKTRVLLGVLIVFPLVVQAQVPEHRLVVLDFDIADDDSISTRLKTAIPDKLELLFFQHDHVLTLVSRRQLRRFLEPMQYQYNKAPLFDKSTIDSLSLYGANLALVGKIERYGEDYTIFITIVNIIRGTPVGMGEKTAHASNLRPRTLFDQMQELGICLVKNLQGNGPLCQFEDKAPPPPPPPITDVFENKKSAAVKIEVQAFQNGEDKSSCGTGFFVGIEEGFGKIITANHLVDDEARQIRQITISGVDINNRPIRLEATVERKKYLDEDLTLLVANLGGRPVKLMTLGDMPEQEDELLGIAYGRGENPTQCADAPGLRTGKVMALYGDSLGLASPSSTRREDTSIREGDSGGPLLNSQGEVVAMIQHGAPDFPGSNIDALASTLLRQLANEPIQHDPALLPIVQDIPPQADTFYRGRLGRLSMSSASWCSDTYTWCPNENGAFFNGVRLLFEPTLGFRGNNPGLNKVDNLENLQLFPRFGFEVNVFAAFVSIQGTIVYVPNHFPSFKLRKGPALEVLKRTDAANPALPPLNPIDIQIESKYAWEVGLSFLDGMFSVGRGEIEYKGGQFTYSEKDYPGAYRDGYYYVAFQPMSFLRTLLKPDVFSP